MKTTLFTLLIVATLAVGVSAFQYAPQTDKPPDAGIQFDNPAVLDSIIAPYVDMALRTYPEARARFIKGLPAGDVFFITTRVFDPTGNFEQIMVKVDSLRDRSVFGRVAAASGNLPGLAPGNPFKCREADIIDWCITKPDGKQEGNVVGKFLDVVRERFVGLVMEIKVARDGSVSAAKCLRAMNRSGQDVSFLIQDSVMRRAEVMARALKYDPPDSVVTKFTYIVYDYIAGLLQEPNPDQRKKPGTGGSSR